VIAHPSVKGVLAEKPLAMKEEDASRVVSLAERRGVILAVNYSRRYASNHRRVRDLIRGGSIGRLQCMDGYYTGGCLHSGTHWFDLARFLIGEITTVQGFDLLGEKGSDPTLDARVVFNGGASGTLRGCDGRAFGIFEADILGTAGRVRILDSGHRVELSVAGENPHYTGYRSLSVRESTDTGFEDLLLHAVEDLVYCMKQGGTPACSGRDGVAALRIASAVRRSAQEGRPVPTGCEGHD
ncbi:MAG: Gfo/Idh/MocA family oxidoreductase, partial [Methanomicrobiales archaeon]|nr:Gfo/Idh/MocA family oxidoreductase [Methanomicrobiales archaeon]